MRRPRSAGGRTCLAPSNSPIENWELRIGYLLSEEASWHRRKQGGQAAVETLEPITNNQFSIPNFQ